MTWFVKMPLAEVREREKRSEAAKRAAATRRRRERAELVRDLNDALNARQTIFVRCACGRLAERGIICPTNQEGGHCEAGS